MNMPNRDAQRRLAQKLYGGFYRCPTTGWIIAALPGDDKVLCNCRTANPRVPQERTFQTGVHIIRYLDVASVDDYLDQHKEDV